MNKSKIQISPTIHINSREDLARVYTPGVGELCKAIQNDESLVKELTIAGKVVAVISDGTAVLGFGDIGPKAALPVMEGKAVIFKEFAGVEAFPICIAEKDPDKFVEIVKAISINFAAINLEDITAPKCFYIENRLQNELDIPVMHDDQHGTAIVVLAGLLGAREVLGKKNLRVVVVGSGAAGTAITKLLHYANTQENEFISDIKVLDSKGVVAKDRTDLNPEKVELAELTNQDKTMNLEQALQGADVFIGVSVRDLLNASLIKTMNQKPIIFALANPVPEIMPEVALEAGAGVVATGRSDFPNQINNAITYPGVFKGLIKNGLKKVTINLKYLVAKRIYAFNKPKLAVDQIIPSIFEPGLADSISEIIK